MAQKLHIDLTTFNASDRLSQNTIQCIYQDRFGFIWIGTQDGLNKYDGYELEIFKYRKGKAQSLPANHITALTEDEAGNLLIGTRTNGLSRFDRAKATFQHFFSTGRGPDQLSSNQINVLFKDRQSRVWVGTPEGLHLLKNGRFSVAPGFTRRQPKDIKAIFEDSRGNIWIGAREGLILLRKGSGNPVYLAWRGKPGELVINAIEEDHSGNIWLGCENNLVLFDPVKNTFTPYQIDPDRNSAGGTNPIFCLLKGERDQLWVGSNTTLQLFDTKQKRLIPISDETDGDSRMPNDGIYALFRDKANAIWIGTSSEGILKYDKSLTVFHSFRAALANIPSAKNIVREIDEDRAGNLYIASDAGVDYFNRADMSYINYEHDPDNPHSLSSNYTTGVICSKVTGEVWISTYNSGLDVLDPVTKKVRHYTEGPGPKQIGSNAIDLLMEDRRGNIWIGTDGAGVNKYDLKTGEFIKYTHSNHPNSVCDNTILALHEDRKGNIWIGGYSNGVSILNPANGTFKHVNTKNTTLTSDVVSCFYEDPSGNMWIGTQGGGLNLFDPKTGKVRPFTEEDGLANNSINFIEGDASGKLWITTNQGIVSFDPVKQLFRTFGKKSNLKAMEFNLGSGEKLQTGEIVVGSINGFNVIDPNHLATNTHKPPVVLTGMYLFNKPVVPGVEGSPLPQTLLTTEKIELDYEQSVFTITFAALDYTSPDNNRYAYMLEGFDREWNHIGNQHQASYTNLNPGTYVFKVKAANNDGLWNENETRLTIRIIAPFWMTWWFKTLFILLVAGTAYIFYQYRLSFVKKQNEKLELLVRKRTARINKQTSHLTRLNQELLEKTTSLEQVNAELEEQKSHERQARFAAEEAQKQADAANSAKSTFLATMSHELRTPLNGVMGMASLLSETTLSNEQREYTSAILNSGESLLSVINDILDFSRIESGKIELEARALDLQKCVEEVLELFGPKIAETGVDLLYEIAGNVPAWIMADGLRLRQILINMVGNAVKFTHVGEVFVSVSAVRTPEADNRLVFKIRDTGIGMPKDQQKNLFKPFNQLDSSVTRRYGGSGLGLVICERLVKLMGGKIEVDSEPGKGTTFTFDIPCVAAVPNADSVTFKVSDDFPGKTILLVDDNQTSLAMLKKQLHTLRSDIRTATSAADAMKLLTADTHLVITDMQMPHTDGLQLAMQIREQHSTLPLILLGPIRDESKKKYQHLFHSIVNKPVRSELLQKAVSEALTREKAKTAEQKAPSLTEAFARDHPLRILVAEDIVMNQKFIVWVLNKLGYEPELASNGVEVLEMMEEKQYDVILMDLQMPKMDGLEATRIIRTKYGEKPLIIALTANAMAEDRENCIKAGMNDYISKPVNLELLTAKLSKLYQASFPG